MRDGSMILMRLSQAESDLIHERAKDGRQTISGYVLKVVLGYVALDENYLAKFTRGVPYFAPMKRPIKVIGPRTTFLVRCSRDESHRIRAAAKRRDATITGYILSALRRTWKVQIKIGRMAR